MHIRFALVALLLPLGGCVVPPDQVGYGYPGAYPQPGYPGAYPQPDYGYPGFSYYDGSPTYLVDGATVPLIFYGGGWGYWDSGHNWHHAPEGVARNLNQRYPGGAGYHPLGSGQPGHPGGPAFGGFPGGPGRPGGPPPGGGFAGRPPGGPPPGGAPRVAAPVPAARSPIAAAVSHATAPAPSGQRKDEHH
jgi:hypothetical protein